MNNINRNIQKQLFEMQDIKYKDFTAKLNPTIDGSTIIGVRTPELRKLAKRLAKEPEIGEFLKNRPHQYYEENNLHAYIIEGIKKYEDCIVAVEEFLPYINSWSTCDTMSPKVFAKHKIELLERIEKWIQSSDTYTIRYGIGMLMAHYLDEDFDTKHLTMVAAAESEEYYVNMMRAWYFATALAKQYEKTIPYIEENRLDIWTHNKTIKKAVESNRITPEIKTYLKTVKR